MTAVLVAVLAASVVGTYETFATQAREQSLARLRTVARLFGQTGAQSAVARLATLGRATRDTAFLGVLRAANEAMPHPPVAGTTARADSLLRALTIPSDSGLPTTLWTADGRRVASVGSTTDPVERGETPAPDVFAVQATDSVSYQRPFAVGDRVYYRVVVPINDGARRAGYVVMLRRIPNSIRVAQMLNDLTGEDADLYVHQQDGETWATVHGKPTRRPRVVGDGLVERDGVTRLSATDVLPGTPWRYTLEEPLSAVLVRPRALLRQLALFAVLLLLTGASASWLIGRRLVRPLGSLTAAAEAIARGDYKSRVADEGRDEIGRLAKSFNAMAAQIDASNRALSHQYEEARAARDAAETANRAKGDFLATMSHELRTPLNAIGGYAELMQLGIYGAVTDEQHSAISRIVRSQQHLLGLINDVLNFATRNAAKVRFDIASVPVAEALAAVEAMTAPQVAAKGLRYESSIDDPSLHVRADREKLQQILLNLVSNAVKFTPSNGRVWLEVSADDDFARFAVRDTGVGIDAARLPRVFEPFVQIDRALNRPHDGVGLGLTISRDLAAGMGGSIDAESEPGVGSTFTLVLPRVRAEAADPLGAR